jgi:excinuclease ABC subunit A
MHGFTASHFSFNSEGGRCPACKGEGVITIEMQFLPDVSLRCDDCQGRRFKDQVLDVKYDDYNIFDILQLTVDGALELFKNEKDIYRRLEPLQKVGLGYIRLGQASSTLSGGEAQRVKLASFIGNIKNTEATLFIFDEPTTGLHTHDILKLYNTFNLLIESGHSIVVVEHNLEILKLSDWIIDLGPDGGINGGKVIYEGIPEEISKASSSFTSKHLIPKLVN